MAKKLSTGRKPGSGRQKKEHADKKTPVNIMLQNRIIDDLGGKKSVQKIIAELITAEHSKRCSDLWAAFPT